MTLPKAGLVPPVRRRKSILLSQGIPLLAVFTTTSTVLILLVLSKQFSHLMLSNTFGLTSSPLLVALQSLEHEYVFHSSIRSCLPNGKTQQCKTFIPDNASAESSKKFQRVALISVDGDVSSLIERALEQIQSQHTLQIRNADLGIEAFSRSSVPPYGYGKTHGLTKIIRLHPQYLILEATTALRSVMRDSKTPFNISSITLDDLKAALRGVLRFHCRLSHVSAHTAIMSLPIQDLRHDAMSALQQLQTFVTGQSYSHQPDKGSSSTPSIEHPIESVLTESEFFALQLLSNLQRETRSDKVIKILDDVLVDEINKTKTFSLWPCLSFWAIGDEPNVFRLSPLTQRLAASFSPNCINDNMASCWVGRDLCEAHADGPCLDNGKQYKTR